MSELSIQATAGDPPLLREQAAATTPTRESEEQARSARTVRGRRPKVLVANKFFFLNGGSEAVMFQEMELMRQAGLDVIEIAMQDPRNRPSDYARYFVSSKDYRSATGLDQVKAALALIRSREAIAQVSRIIEEQRPDILHCHNIYHQLTPSIINVAARHHVPVVLTLHDYKPVCPVYTQLSHGQVCTQCADGGFEAVLRNRCADGSLARSALLWAEARYHALAGSYHHVAKFIAPSRFMRDAISRRFGDDKVTYIRNAIDASQITPAQDDDNYVLYLGRLTPEKGIKTLLRAHASDYGDWRLVVAGTGPLAAELRGRFPKAEFAGHLTGADLERVLSRASVVVVPSEWHENSPLSILEAMAHGKPVVASRIGGIPELVRDGETGLLVEPKEIAQFAHSIRTLMNDPALRAQLGRNARRVVETEHALSQHGAALLSLYDSLI